MKIYPSLISSDLLYIGNTLELLDPHCDGYHVDVMDFHFVPNLTWGPPFIDAITQKTQRPLQVHLMVDNPLMWLERLYLREHDSFIFHFETIESDHDLTDLITKVVAKPCKVGIAINPETPPQNIFPFLSLLDIVLIMSVNPGFSGQKFMPEVMQKIGELVTHRSEQDAHCIIGLDGGVTTENISELAIRKADFVAVAAAIFSHANIVSAVQNLREKSLG
jgi:ribulose-phosphate 3-epimerase